jgi:hypothetical protein
MLPTRKEMMSYWFEHPIAGSIIAFGMVEGIKTLWESAVNPKGRSPFSSYTSIRSGDALNELDLGQVTNSELQASVNEMEAHHSLHYGNHKMPEESGALGSSSTTTSTSSAHGGTIRTHAGSTWDKQRAPGERAEMFGMPKKKGSILMGPPSARRRISINSFTLGGLSQAPQTIATPEEDGLPKTSHFDILGMMPEQSDDATDNPWV